MKGEGLPEPTRKTAEDDDEDEKEWKRALKEYNTPMSTAFHRALYPVLF
jgi:hypothetical protein